MAPKIVALHLVYERRCMVLQFGVERLQTRELFTEKISLQKLIRGNRILAYKLVRGTVSWSKKVIQLLRFYSVPAFQTNLGFCDVPMLFRMDVRWRETCILFGGGRGVHWSTSILKENSWVDLIDAQHYAQDTFCVFVAWARPLVACICWLRSRQTCSAVWICVNFCLNGWDPNLIWVLNLFIGLIGCYRWPTKGLFFIGKKDW